MSVAQSELDLLDAPQTLRTLSVARHWVPHDGKPISTATMFRWASRGCQGVTLQVLRTPRGTFTSQDAINEFLRRVDQSRRGNGQEVETVTPEQLESAGLLSQAGR